MPVRSLNSSVLKWLDMRTVDQAARAWAAETGRKHLAVLKISYFGSYARGDWGVGSDLDLIILLTETGVAEPLPFWQRALQFDLSGLPVPAEALVYTFAEWQAMAEKSPRFHAALEQEAVWIFQS